MKRHIVFSLLSLFIVLTLTHSEAFNVSNAANNLYQLNEYKRIIMETFDTIDENRLISLSSTAETVKTAEPELYDSMLSQGAELLPAILSLLEESIHDKRSAELYMLYKDIQESIGEPVLDYYNMTPPLPESSSDDTGTPTYVWWAEVDPSVNIPEPDNTDNPPPDYIRWEPMLGCYIYRDAYYVEELSMVVLEEFPQELPSESVHIILSVQPDVAGSASASPEIAPTGETVSLTQEAAQGYRFKEWTATDGTFTNSKSASTTFIVPANDVTITANFYLVGDVDNDGMVTMADAMLIFDYLSGTSDLTSEQMMAADVDGDTIVSMADFMRIFDYLSGLRPLP